VASSSQLLEWSGCGAGSFDAHADDGLEIVMADAAALDEPQSSGMLPRQPQPRQQTTPAGLSELQQLQRELDDLTCQLVFMDDCELAADTAAAAGSDSPGRGMLATGSRLADGGASTPTPVAPRGGAPAPPEVQRGMRGGLSLFDDADMADVAIIEVEEGCQLGGACGPDEAAAAAAAACGDGGTPAAAHGTAGTASQVQQPGAAAELEPASGAAAVRGTRGVLLAGARPSLAHMVPAERAAWVVVAKQRQQQLYGRFIELAVQNQQAAAAAASGSCGLQQLMRLVSECIRAALVQQQQGAGAGELQGGGSSISSVSLSAMQLISMVQSRHQAMVMQQQHQHQQQACSRAAGPRAAGSVMPSADDAAVIPPALHAGQQGGRSTSTPAVAQQRLFVALLNVAHQSNTAAAAARGAGEQQPRPGDDGAGGAGGGGGGGGAPSTAHSWLPPGTRISFV
jgi:hypothetical protein